MEKLSGGSYIQAVYDPRGDELALMFNGTALAEARTPLVDGSAVRYTSGGLDSYFHPDWLGSTRFKSTPSGTVKDDVAFAPFGEQYVTSGPVDSFFTVAPHDMEVDLRDFPAREYHTTQGRWLTPDPAGLEAVDLTNPQTLNRYGYVMNDPLANVDPTGMDACFTYYTVNNGDGPTFIASTTCYTTIPKGEDPQQPTYGNRGGTQTGGSGPGQPKKSGTQPCVAPNLLQRAGIAVQGLIARISGTAIGFGVGGSFAAGNRVGVSLSISRQLVVLPNGEAAFTTSVTLPSGTAFNSAVTPGIGAYGGLQLSLSKASSVGDLGGSSADYGYGGGAGLAGGVDLSVGSGSKGQRIWQLNLTGGAGVSAPAGIGHGFSFVSTSATPICGG